MVKAIQIRKPGGPEAMEWTDVEVGMPGPGEARVRLHAAGLNFLDVYHRTGLYPLPLPSGIGMEGAGEVEEVGEGVTEVRAGDRVAFTEEGRYRDGARVVSTSTLELRDGRIVRQRVVLVWDDLD